MKEDVNIDLSRRFIPYIQLHEFEGLLFNNIEVFQQNFTVQEIVDYNGLVTTIEAYQNPEMINDTVENAPSKRLERYILGYNKVLFGSMLAESIGLDKIRHKSIRFNKWIQALSEI